MAAVNSRYARAFADVVLERKLDAHAAGAQLEVFQSLLRQSSELRNVWENPAVPGDQKLKLLDAVAARVGATRELRNFIAVLIDHRRIGALDNIARQFQVELNQRLGIARAEVSSARELGEEERRALEAQLVQLTGKKVQAEYRRDPALLGGAVVRVGSTIYDGSVKGQLQKIKETLIAG